jgi:hypothetical protein
MELGDPAILKGLTMAQPDAAVEGRRRGRLAADPMEGAAVEAPAHELWVVVALDQNQGIPGGLFPGHEPGRVCSSCQSADA